MGDSLPILKRQAKMKERYKMIYIKLNSTKIKEDGWDYPIDELEYLWEEHDGETFVLIGDRLYEADV